MLEDKDYDARADVWSCGILLLEMLCRNAKGGLKSIIPTSMDILNLVERDGPFVI